MKVVETVSQLQQRLNELNLHPVGFVPTMGALHEGHLSLIVNAINRCPVVVISIFVNPTQFNDKNDLINYPRIPEEDIELIRNSMRENDLVFMPAVKEVYPGEDKRSFSFGNLDMVMEAVHRPGHFTGVAQVVSRLFDIVKPDIAYFGQKDFQQLAVIKSLVKQTGINVAIIGNPIIREKDGLAMSSRNRLLEPHIRKLAPVIFKTISKAAVMISNNEISDIKAFVKDSINNIPDFKIEYFDIVDDNDLIPVNNKEQMKKDKQYYGCIAVHAGKIRLIDNIKIELC